MARKRVAAALCALGLWAGTPADAAVVDLRLTGHLSFADGAYQVGDDFVIDLPYSDEVVANFDPDPGFSSWNSAESFSVTIDGETTTYNSPIRISYQNLDDHDSIQFMAQDANSNVTIFNLPARSALSLPSASDLSRGSAHVFFLTGSGRGGGEAFLTSTVPEPGTWALMAIGVGAIGVARRRHRFEAA